MTLALSSSFFKKVLETIFSYNVLVWTSIVTRKHLIGDEFFEFVENMGLIVRLTGAKITLKHFSFWPISAF